MSYIKPCIHCGGTNGGHYKTCENYGGLVRAIDSVRTLKPPKAMNTQDLIALRTRLERIYNACCSTAPKQAVGEMVAAMLAMPEWDAIAAAQPNGEKPHWHSCDRLLPHDWAMNADGSFTCVRCQLHQPKADERGSAEPDNALYVAAMRTLLALGYHWDGGKEWKSRTAPARDGSEPGPADAGAQELINRIMQLVDDYGDVCADSVTAPSVEAWDTSKEYKAIESALTAALASPPPQSSPQDAQRVGYIRRTLGGDKVLQWVGPNGIQGIPEGTSLYAAPQASQSAPVAGMTDSQIMTLADSANVMSFHYSPSNVVAFARAIEAALREKDGGKA